jgi:apolipoprotein N-acyltransferase
LFGFIFSGYSFLWLYTTYPIIWLSEGPLQLVGIFILHVILSLLCALSFSVVGIVSYRNISKYQRPFLFALTLTGAEFFRSLLISLLYLGKESTLGLHFTSGTLGNALSTTPFIEYAYLGGIFSLTFVLGYFVYSTQNIHSWKYYKYHTLLLVVGVITLHNVAPIHTPKEPFTVGVITTDFNLLPDEDVTQSTLKKRQETIHLLTKSFAPGEPNAIVYPEDTRYTEQLSPLQITELLSRFKNTLFVDGTTRRFKKNSKNVSDEGFSNYSLFYDLNAHITEGRGKVLLMPFNEYLPYALAFIFTTFNKDNVEAYDKRHGYTRDDGMGAFTFGSARVGTLICSEILSFDVVRSLARTEPNIVMYQTYLTVFHNNPLFLAQMRSFTKIAAAQLRTPIIQSSNGSESYMISPYGEIMYVIPRGFKTSLYKIEGGTITETAHH